MMTAGNNSTQILSDITVFNKYAKYLPEFGRRETWTELCQRNIDMHIKKYPLLSDEINKVYKDFVITKKVLPSLRSMQFAGKPIELSPNRIFNCCFVAIDDYRTFSEIMFLLLGGTGVGYSVQKNHVAKLPPVKKPAKTRRYVVGDSIEGWADAVKTLMSAYFNGKALPNFDFSDIRPKGAALVTSGGKAPGPEPLKDCIHNLKKILDRKKDGEQLTTLEVHDMVCYIADAVLAGGIRRAALIALFNIDDEDMLSCKYDNWYELNPQRARANNSAVIMRHRVKKADFLDLWGKIQASGSGEPGIYFSNNAEYGTNPSLRKGTRVLTSNGIFPIEELQDKSFQVKNLNGKISEAKCWLSGKDQPLYKITLIGGKEYYSTPQHEWPVVNNGDFTKIRTDKLRSGDLLPVIREDKLFDGDLGTREDGFILGWQLGDGWLTIRSDNGCTQHGFIVSKKDCEYGIDSRIESYLHKLGSDVKFLDRGTAKELNTVSNVLNKNLEKFGASNKENGLPKAVWTGSEEFRKGIIDGIFSSDGHIEKNDKRIVLTSSRVNLIQDVADLLGFYGIKSSVIKGKSILNNKEFVRYDLKISERKSIQHFRNLFTLSVGYKQDTLNGYKLKQTYKNDTIKIKSVEKTDLMEDVWDISVCDNTHCFQLSNCITGNCCEVALRYAQFCNLVEMNLSNIESQEDLNARAKAAAFIATLQAGYTDFHYLRDVWKRTTEKEALIGVSGTGIASGAYKNCNLQEAAKVVADENSRVAKLIGINTAARQTNVKPAGTSSLVFGTSSGIHSWFDKFYIRRMKLGKNEALYKYVKNKIPQLIEDDFFKPNLDAFITIPIAAPKGAIVAPTETAMQLLERIKFFSENWVKPGHVKGDNSHNISATVYIKDNEWDEVGEWMWNNRESYNGLAVLPFDGGTYTQAPHESITEEKYNELLSYMKDLNLAEVIEIEDNTTQTNELACAGGVCEIQY